MHLTFTQKPSAVVKNMGSRSQKDLTPITYFVTCQNYFNSFKLSFLRCKMGINTKNSSSNGSYQMVLNY